MAQRGSGVELMDLEAEEEEEEGGGKAKVVTRTGLTEEECNGFVEDLLSMRARWYPHIR